MPVGSPFPHHLWNSPFWNTSEKTLPMVSLWRSSKNSGNLVKSMVERCSKIKLSKCLNVAKCYQGRQRERV